MNYRITLRNCAFFARHGVLDAEKVLGQRFYVDAVMDVASEAAARDDIQGTVDYGAAFAVIERIVTGTRRQLIEALAADIGRSLCENFPQISRVEITVRKPSAPIAGVLDHAEVSVVWPQ